MITTDALVLDLGAEDYTVTRSQTVGHAKNESSDPLKAGKLKGTSTKPSLNNEEASPREGASAKLSLDWTYRTK